MTHVRIDGTVEERLIGHRHVADTGCWEWTGSCLAGGYGQIGIQGKNRKVSRVAYETWVGAIPDGLWILHHCDNRLCFNPDHLFLGTHRDNMDDAVRKGRMNVGESNVHAKLTAAEVAVIKGRIGQPRGWMTLAAAEFGVTVSMVNLIAQGKNWKSVQETA